MSNNLVYKYRMKIMVQSTDSQAMIQIDIISNPPLIRWFEQCVRLQETYPITGRLIFHDTSNIASRSADNESEIYANLLITSNRLEALLAEKSITNFVIPKFSKNFNRSQHWLNDIHNVFVDVSLWIRDNGTQYWQLSDSWDSKIFETASELNLLIHKLEKWVVPTSNRQYIKNYSHKHLQTQFDVSHHGIGLWFTISQEEQQLYHSTYQNNEFYQVVFSNNILGKTYYWSFVDEEAANSPAISGIDATWGNLDIKLDQKREDILRNPRFQTWLDTVNNNPKSAPLEFPVGSINPNSNLDYFTKRKVANVIFNFVN